MTFTRPELLWLLPIVIWFWRPSRGASRQTPVNAHAWRSVLALLIVLSAAGLHVSWAESPIALMFVLDRSHSTTATQDELVNRVQALAAQMHRGDRAGLVVFGRTAAVERPPGPAVDARSITVEIAPSGTNIEAALRVARTTLPSGYARRLVLLSDGLQTSGDVLAEAARAALDDVRVDVVIPADSRSASRLEIVRVAAPTTARVGEPFEITVAAAGVPGVRGIIELRGSGGPRRQAVTVSASGTAVASFDETSSRAGTVLFEATAHPAQASDFDPEERAAGALVTIIGAPRVLYVGGTPDPLRSALSRAAFRVQAVDGTALPRSAAALAEYDAIVLDDVRATDLDAQRAAALASHIEQRGGGLLVLGGPESLEPGALAGTTLGDLLPVDFRPRGGQRAPAMALVIAFDKSGSMDDRVDGVPRIEFARQAVRRIFDTVPATDALGVIAFDAAPHQVAALGPGQDVRTVTAALAAVQPGGGTAIAPAVAMAAGWLREAVAASLQRRHVLLVSDGSTSPADATQLAEIVKQGGFELSVVALGGERDRRFLEGLARATGGRAYFPKDIRELPAIAARESARVAGGRLVEEPFRPRALSHAILRGLDTGTLPLLGGYVVGVAKPAAETAIQSPLDDPVLAAARRGLGRVAVYSADLHSAWSASLRTWSGVDTLFVQATRWVARRGDDASLFARFVEEGDSLRLIVEAETPEGEFLNGLTCEAIMRAPSGATTTVALSATAPGRYDARVAPQERGAYVFAITAASADRQVDSRIVRGVYWSADAEYRRAPVDSTTLSRIAEITGGRVLSAGDNPFSGPRDRRYFDASPWLAGVALVLFLIEVLLLPLQRRRGLGSGPFITSTGRSAKRTVPTAAA
jgi:Mg-chelatase subunit ChlD